LKHFAYLAGVALLAVPPLARADLVANVATGLDSSGNLITADPTADANWTSPSAAAALPVFPNDADWYGGWLGNGPNSDWIARDDNTAANGTGTYTRLFNLAGFNVSTAAISGFWAIDDSGHVALNGKTIASLPAGAWGALTAFSDSNSADFLPGVNTLTITIDASDNFLEAVRMEGSVTAQAGSPVPEPSSLALFWLGACLVGGYAWRRRQPVA
jgi:hypothetical protein